jgi:hypothetical protein
MDKRPPKLKKIALFPFQDTAVGFYRVLQPGRVLVREKLCGEARSLPFSGEEQSQFYEYQDKTYLEMTKNADVMWSTIQYKYEYMLKFLNLRKYNSQLKDCKLVYDVDDNLYALPQDNLASDNIKELKRNFEGCLRGCDGVTVSTPNLEKIYEPLNDNIYVNPNGLDFSIWDKLKTKKNTKKKIRIGWRGASGHKDDLESVGGALEAIAKDYSVEFVLWSGAGFAPELKLKYESAQWVSTFEYPNKLASLNLDIAIIPLIDSAYNRCKSNLGYLEFSALKIPTVLTPTVNQKNMVSLEARSNFEWYRALEKLIKDKKYRTELGQKTYDFIHKNYNVRSQVYPLADWMSKLPLRKDLEPDK